MDSKSIQNTDSAEEKGYDVGKTSSIKLLTDIDVLGLPHQTLMVTTANVTDRRGATDLIVRYCGVTAHLSRLQKVLVDGRYTGDKFANKIKKISGAKIETVECNKLHNPQVESLSFGVLVEERPPFFVTVRKLELTDSMALVVYMTFPTVLP